jgi:hypothetical protein
MLYVVKIHDQSHPSIADLIFEGSKPIAVLAWAEETGGRVPLVSVPLDAGDLSKFDGNDVDYIYCRELQGPVPH